MKSEFPLQGLAKVKPNWDYYGLIDINGNYVLEPNYNNIYEWNNGIARVEKEPSKFDKSRNWLNLFNGKYGFINFRGEMITDFSYGMANDFSYGLAAVNKNKKWGFIDKNGQLVVPCKFDSVNSFIKNSCIVSINNKFGLIDRQGNWILENTYEYLSDFAFGMSVAISKKGFLFNNIRKFIIDSNGNKIIDLPKKWEWFKPVSEKLILIGTTSNFPGERIYGFMDLKGNIKTKPQFHTNSDSEFNTGEFINGKLFVATKDGIHGFVNEEGEFEKSELFINENKKKSIKIKHSPYAEILEFSEGLAIARKGKFWGAIDLNYNVVVDFKYNRRMVRQKNHKGLFFSDPYPKYSCGLIGICDERETIYSGYIDKFGSIAIELKYRIAKPFYSNADQVNNT